MDITSDFRSVCLAREKTKKNASHTNAASSKPKKSGRITDDTFTNEAYRIVSRIEDLRKFLIKIRRAYLNPGGRISTGPKSSEKLHQIDSNSRTDPFAQYASSTSLTDKERDEIDFNAKILIRQCMERIKELEEADKLRQEKMKNLPMNKFAKFLAQTLFSAEREQDWLTAHRTGVIWYLNNRLMEVSDIQKTQQEQRMSKQLERREFALNRSIAARRAIQKKQAEQEYSDTHHTEAPSTTVNSNLDTPTNGTNFEEEDSHPEFEEELSSQEKSLLQLENDAIMRELETTADQVKEAERALLEVSTLQSALASHLAVQTQQINTLHAEALANTERMQEGNIHLTRARQRNADTRKWVLLFLIIASAVLLFLDWYD
ncbi:uncharacterized protein VTP21DRAFT_10571 [Calcarisporiella thermophila]|uniref:uncharacterized protein n=1 Tax=Calcarisporiella thermophila TaxID=911321 RepID=UPI003742FCEE